MQKDFIIFSSKIKFEFIVGDKMSLELKLVIFILGGILQYFLMRRKKIVNSIPVIIFYIGVGVKIFGNVTDPNFSLYFAIIMIIVAIICGIFELFIKKEKSE